MLPVEQHAGTGIADRCDARSHGDVVLHETGEQVGSDPDLLVASSVGRQALPEETEG